MNLAFVTDSAHDDFASDDRLLVSYLQSKQYTIHPVVWDDPNIRWATFDLIIFRSPWDYFLKIEAFTQCLNLLESQHLKVFNPVSVLKWNKNKNYLIRFRALGIPIPEFQYCNQGEPWNIKNILNQHRWVKAVIKPSISGGAYKTWITDHAVADQHQGEFKSLLRDRDMIVQEFSEHIATSGELSLIYFNKEFSHAVIKKAKAGEFRVQAQYGGQHQPYLPDSDLLQQVDNILSLIPERLLYARIDGYLDDQKTFYLMELELLEPLLFFDSDPHACKKFHRAIYQLTHEQIG